MNTEEVRNAISVLEKALKEGLLDTPNNARKMDQLNKLAKSKPKKITTKEIFSESNKDVSSASSVFPTDSEFDDMTHNPVPSEYFIQSDKNSDSDRRSDFGYNLAMSNVNLLSGCSKDSDEIIDLNT